MGKTETNTAEGQDVAGGADGPRSKVWIERGGQVVLSDWRVALLEEIDATGSLSRAAERLDVPYRTAWQKVREMEERLGVSLLDRHSGGSDGGSSTLTAEARDLVRRFRHVTEGLAQLIDARYRDVFGDWPNEAPEAPRT